MEVMVLFWFVVWGVVCAIIAVNRGRTGIGWFVLGVLFSFFALIVLLVLPNPEQEWRNDRDARLKAEDEERRRAAEQLREERDHQRRIAEIAALKSGAAEETKICPRCAETVKRAALVCRFCGHEFGQTSSVSIEPQVEANPATATLRYKGFSYTQNEGEALILNIRPGMNYTFSDVPSMQKWVDSQQAP